MFKYLISQGQPGRHTSQQGCSGWASSLDSASSGWGVGWGVTPAWEGGTGHPEAGPAEQGS